MRAVAVMFLAMLCSAGCGSQEPGYPVSGVVLYCGQPLAGGLIVFTPDSDRGNNGSNARAIINADGSFTLTTDEKKGALRGWYRIAIAPPVDEHSRQRYKAFPSRLRNPLESGLRWEVKEKDELDPLIEITP